ncbi:hypothetical protein HanOQP8_Chr16g0610861 [Helianthus annuus]|nr:hypothetical protein HanOQP8_Chr16g0610861 [Helianthus annuus]
MAQVGKASMESISKMRIFNYVILSPACYLWEIKRKYKWISVLFNLQASTNA